jgi:hypothetical protein
MAFLAPALAKLRNEIDQLAPNRSTISDGWIGDPAHASRDSDHNPEPDGSVDAIDVTHDPGSGADMNRISEQIKMDSRLRGGGYLIWSGRIWNPDVSLSWRTYTGSNPHNHHMHVSVSDQGQNSTADWLDEREEDLPLNQEDLAAIRTIVQNNTDRTIAAVQRQTDQAQATTKAQVKAVIDLVDAVAAVQGVDPAKVRQKLKPATRAILADVD